MQQNVSNNLLKMTATSTIRKPQYTIFDKKENRNASRLPSIDRLIASVVRAQKLLGSKL